MGNEHLWDQRSLSVRQGERIAQRAELRNNARTLPRFGPQRCVIPYSCLVVLSVFLANSRSYSILVATHAEWAFKESIPPLSMPWASFYVGKGLPQVAYEIRNEVESNYSAITVLSYLTLTA